MTRRKRKCNEFHKWKEKKQSETRERNKDKQVSSEQKQEQKQQDGKLVIEHDQSAIRDLLFPCCFLRAKQRRKSVKHERSMIISTRTMTG
jgi:hypothetical protein